MTAASRILDSTHAAIAAHDNERVCLCHGLPVIRRVFRPQYGDPILRDHCPDDDEVVVGVTRRDLEKSRKREAA